MVYKRGIFNIRKSYSDKSFCYKIFSVLVFCLLFYEMIMLCYVNLTQLSYHMGYDASSYYLKAIEIWKQKTLFIDHWVEQTTLYFDSPVPLAALFMFIFKDIFLSYGVANLIIDFFMILFLIRIMKKLKLSPLAVMVVLSIFLCPFISPNFGNSNDLGYFSCILTSCSCYSVKILISFMVLDCFLMLSKKNKLRAGQWILILLTCVLVFISAVSSGYHVGITVLAPILVYGIFRVLHDNSLKRFLEKDMLFIYGNLALTLAGKWFAETVIQYTSRENGITLIGLERFWHNFGSIFLGYLKLLAGMKYESNVVALSAEGIGYLVGLFLALIFVILFLCCMRKSVKNAGDHTDMILLGIMVVYHIAMYAVISSSYGDPVFEIRYLILPFLIMVICMAKTLDDLDEGLLVKWFALGGVLVCTAIMAIGSYQRYMDIQIDRDTMNELKETVSEIDSPVVYVLGDEFLGRNMRAFDINKIYKAADITESGITVRHWGDYTYFDRREECPGKVILIITHGIFSSVPEEIRQQAVLYKEMDTIGVYYLENNLLGTTD